MSKRSPHWASWRGMGRRCTSVLLSPIAAWRGRLMLLRTCRCSNRLWRWGEAEAWGRCCAFPAHLRVLQQAVALVANVRVRNVGTLGGNLCFGDPHSDPAPVLLVYNARVKIGKHGGERSIGLDEFYIGL